VVNLLATSYHEDTENTKDAQRLNQTIIQLMIRVVRIQFVRINP